jgi:hypothetical protein
VENAISGLDLFGQLPGAKFYKPPALETQREFLAGQAQGAVLESQGLQQWHHRGVAAGKLIRPQGAQLGKLIAESHADDGLGIGFDAGFGVDDEIVAGGFETVFLQKICATGTYELIQCILNGGRAGEA